MSLLDGITRNNEVWVTPLHGRHRGIESALTGIAHRVSKKTGLSFSVMPADIDEHLDNEIKRLGSSLTPEFGSAFNTLSIKGQNARSALVRLISAEYFRLHGCPRLVLANSVFDQVDNFNIFDDPDFVIPGLVCTIGSLTTGHWHLHGAEHRNIVPHAVTPERLREAAQKWNHLKQDNRPLIGICFGYINEDDRPDILRCLTRLFDRYPTARFVITSSPRTPSHFFNLTCQIRQLCQARGGQPDITLFDWHRDPPEQNPNLGLLALADHKIIFGESYSMVSEQLSAGKSVHVRHNSSDDTPQKSYGRLTENGTIRVLDDNNPALITKPVHGFDVTETVANTIVQRYLDHQRRLFRDLPQPDEIDRLALRMRDYLRGRGLLQPVLPQRSQRRQLQAAGL